MPPLLFCPDCGDRRERFDFWKQMADEDYGLSVKVGPRGQSALP
jgi:hypothetical protein